MLYIIEIDEPIVLINDTPDVVVNEAAGTATVRVDFTLRNDAVSALCSLGPDFPETDCEPHLSLQLCMHHDKLDCRHH